jgi:hypothetical protein
MENETFNVNTRVRFISPRTGREVEGVVTKKLQTVFVNEREVKTASEYFWVPCTDMVEVGEGE